MIAVVTGSARGIGADISAFLREKGWEVVGVDILEADVLADLTDPTEVSRACASILSAHPKIDLLVNNAGIGGSWVPLSDQKLEDWEKVIGLNLRAPYLMTQKLQSALSGSSVVNIASTRALMSEPNTEAYAATKGGLVALTHALAISLAEHQIRVNCISPGWIETGDYAALSPEAHRQHPAGRVGKPRDISETVLFLAQAEFVTGANFVVDGGMTRKMIYTE